MAFKGIRLKKVQAIILLLVLFLNINPCIAMGLDSQNLIFNNYTTSLQVGYIDDMIPSLSVDMSSDCTAVFNVYDCNDNLVKQGFTQGKIVATEDQFPLRLDFVGSILTTDWSCRITVNYISAGSISESDVDLSEIESLLSKIDDDMLDRLDELKDKLEDIKEKLQDIFGYVVAINDFLSNPDYLSKGANDLKNSVDNLTSKKIVSDLDSTSSALSGLNGSGSSGGFEIPLEIAEQKFNALDFSALEEQLKTIRNLMSAIMWIEFAVFCIKIVVPKFKV